jgi:hypothetical protein
MTKTKCSTCGTQNTTGDAYCAHCGQKLRRSYLGVYGVLFVVCLWIVIAIFFGAGNRHERAKLQTSAAVAPAPTPPITSHDRLVWAQNAVNTRDYSEGLRQLVFIGKSDPEFAEARKLGATALKLQQTEKERLAPQVRESLRAEYQGFLTTALPHLNYIGSKLTKVKGGYALWGTHEYFTRYTFTIGDTGPAVSKWIDEHRRALEDAGIVRVGVMGRGPFSSWNYFDL